jgi:spore germination protein KC
VKKSFFIIVSILSCIVILTGCWDKRELNTVGIVYAVGLEKDRISGKILCTTQVIRAAALKKESGSKQSSVEIVTGTGDTVFEAIRNILMKFDRKLIFSHNKVIVIDEDLAKEGVFPILDFFARYYEIRHVDSIVIAKPKKVREILGVEDGIANIQGVYLEDIIDNGRFNSKVARSNLAEFLKRSLSNGINPVSGVMETIEQPNLPIEKKEGKSTTGVKLLGTAVFKLDKLIGYLNPDETRGFNWIIGDVKGGVINIHSLKDPNKLVSINIKKSKSSIKPEIIDGKISFNIEIKEAGDIAEVEDSTDISDLKVMEELQNQQKKIIEDEIKIALDKIQKILPSDILGFGRAFSKKYPKVWKDIKKDWDIIFPTVQYTVNVDVKLVRPGLMFKSIEPKK